MMKRVIMTAMRAVPPTPAPTAMGRTEERVEAQAAPQTQSLGSDDPGVNVFVFVGQAVQKADMASLANVP